MEKERMAAETRDERAAILCRLCVATLLGLTPQCSTFIHLVILINILYTADVPVFPTVTAVITLQKYMLKEHPIGTFLIPRDYKKVSQWSC